MKRQIFLIFLSAIFLISIVSAATWPICIDLKMPSAPTDLQATGNLNLVWTASTDKPDCSGIAYYNVYKNGVFLDKVNSTIYSGTALPDGTYTFWVRAVDKVGHEGAKAEIKATFPLSSGSGGDTGGSSGGGSSGGGGGGGGGGSSTTTTTPKTTTQTTTTSTTTGSQETGTGETEQETTTASPTTAEGNGFSGITVAATGVFGSAAGIGVLIFVLVIIAIYIYVNIMRKREE